MLEGFFQSEGEWAHQVDISGECVSVPKDIPFGIRVPGGLLLLMPSDGSEPGVGSWACAFASVDFMLLRSVEVAAAATTVIGCV